jgi:hypothetical protein
MASKAEARRVASPSLETNTHWTAVDSKAESSDQDDFDLSRLVSGGDE